MPGESFRLRSTLSASARANENEIRNAKRIFGSLGYFEPHARQLSKRSDNDLFESVRRFQSDHGLTTDGVIKPGGETEQMLGKILDKKRSIAAKSTSSLVATPEMDTKPSLLDPFPSRTPGIIPNTGKDRTSNDMRRTTKLNQDIKGLLELISRKAQDNEVIAEGVRTMKAALKTADHTELAKLHATAVADFGDEALAEIEDFRKQLLAANKPAHDSWLQAFKSELPKDAERMMLASDLDARKLKDSKSDDTLRTEKQVGLSEETVGVPPRKPETAKHTEEPQDKNEPTLATDLADHPEFKGIDLTFVQDQEGKVLRTDLYIPKNRTTDEVIGKSGVTVGYGVDLGRMEAAELQRLGDQHGLSQGLIDKLKPYTRKTEEEAAAFLEANPLTISDEEARQLTTAKYIDTMVKLRRSANKHLRPHEDFDNLPAPVKTVVYDLAINYGPNFLDKHKRFRARLEEGILAGMIDELRNYGGPPELEGRRNNEAKELEKLLRSWQS